MIEEANATAADEKSVVRSLVRSIHVIQAINLHGSLSLTEIARLARIPFPTAYRIVNTLLQEGLIEREPLRKQYRPTALIQSLACGFQNHDRLVTIARPVTAAFTDRYHWPLSVVTRVGTKMVVRYSTSVQTTLTFNNYYPGWQVPLLASASGQVYLAFAADHVRANLLEQSTTLRSPDSLMLSKFQDGSAGERIRKDGYAAVAKTHYSANPGRTSSLAVPIFDGEELAGSLALVFFANAMTLDRAIKDFLEPLKVVADQIGKGLLESSEPQ